MGVLCEASKIACDNLVMQFNKLNAATRESVRATSLVNPC